MPVAWIGAYYKVGWKFSVIKYWTFHHRDVVARIARQFCYTFFKLSDHAISAWFDWVIVEGEEGEAAGRAEETLITIYNYYKFKSVTLYWLSYVIEGWWGTPRCLSPNSHAIKVIALMKTHLWTNWVRFFRIMISPMNYSNNPFEILGKI